MYAAVESAMPANCDRARHWAWATAATLPAAIGVVAALAGTTSESPLVMTWIGGVGLAIAVVAMYVDGRWQLLPNWLTYPAILWGLAINTTASAIPSAPVWMGAVGIVDSFIGCGIVFTMMLVVFSITGGGAGDVKLSAAIGALFGLQRALDVLILSFIAAGIIVVLWFFTRVGLVAGVRLLARRIGTWIKPAWFDSFQPHEAELLRTPIALGPCFAIGILVVLFTHQIGQ